MGPEEAVPSGGRHAALHDFCMCIPYGIVVALGGLIAAAAGSGVPALYIAAAGVAEVVLSNLSLKAWRAGRSSAPLTLLAAGIAAAVGWTALQAWKEGVSKLATGSLLSFSAAAGAFLLYNVAAGGNPPRGSHAAKASS